MPSTSYINQLTVHDYAKEAFCLDPTSPTGFGQGGIYAGRGSSSPLDMYSDTGRNRDLAAYQDWNDRHVHATARLVTVRAGKIFVRWVRTGLLKEGWTAASGGAWWSSDSIADRIVTTTRQRYGPRGDSGLVAREVSNVGYTWGAGDARRFGPIGTYRSDMGAAVVVKTRAPMQVLIGVGRPVINSTLVAPGVLQDVELNSRELQIVILVTWRGVNHAADLFDKVFFGTSTDLTDWWTQQDPVGRRRTAQRLGARGR